jgi:co-chaperonin GroES (HSP10)
MTLKEEFNMKMFPTGDYLLLKKREDVKSNGGIILSSQQGSLVYADVVAAGPGIFTQTGDRIKMDFKEGQVVITRSDLLTGSSNRVELDGEKYYLVRASEILMADENV